MIDRADAACQPCYLETAQPTNLAFYEKLGFESTSGYTGTQSGLRLWTFPILRFTPVNRPSIPYVRCQCGGGGLVRVLLAHEIFVN